jgi:hypothetical protein
MAAGNACAGRSGALVGAADAGPADPEEERLAAGEVPPALDPARLGDELLASPPHGLAGRKTEPRRLALVA